MKKLMLLIVLVMAVAVVFGQQDNGKKEIPVSSDSVQQAVEVEASVDADASRAFLISHLQPVIDKAGKKGISPGKYTVNVRFLVEKDGSVSDVKALNDIGYGVSEKMEKIFKSAPKWKPGLYKGKAVRSYHTQPIHLEISK